MQGRQIFLMQKTRVVRISMCFVPEIIEKERGKLAKTYMVQSC
jgi:hypothetical protein